MCAQGYLRLSKHSDHYVIRLQPSKQNSPLSNEQYILDLIRQGHLSHIDYQKWYGHCVEDGVQLGLFKPPKNDLFNYSRQYIIQFNRKHKRKADLLFLILFIIIIGALIAKDFDPSDTLSSIVPWIVIGGLAVITIRLLIKLVIAAGKLSKEASRRTFKAELTNHLTKTPQGTAELQKLLAFRNFLAQFRTFIDKDPEAVILWNRYLSYAQVFGLSKEIMRSGYQQLIDNAAFKIDDIDNISLQNISS